MKLWLQKFPHHDYRSRLYTELFYAIIPTLFHDFLLFCYPCILWHFFNALFLLLSCTECPCILTYRVNQIMCRLFSLPFLGLGMKLFWSIFHSTPNFMLKLNLPGATITEPPLILLYNTVNDLDTYHHPRLWQLLSEVPLSQDCQI